MTVRQARIFIVNMSILGTAGTFLFFMVGKPLGYPLSWSQVQRLVEIVLPVFLGYLGAASLYVFGRKGKNDDVSFGQNEDLAGRILWGSAGSFAVILVAILFAFGYTNRPSATQDEGMSIDTLSWAVTAVLGILNVSTNVAVTYLFSVSPVEQDDAGQGAPAHKKTQTTLSP